MDNKFESKMPPVDTYVAGESKDEATEVVRLDDGVSNLEGAVVVGGRAGADCFWGERTIQAGVKDPESSFTFGPDGIYKWQPKERPW